MGWTIIDRIVRFFILVVVLVIAFITGILGMFTESRAYSSRDTIKGENDNNMKRYRMKAVQR